MESVLSQHDNLQGIRKSVFICHRVGNGTVFYPMRQLRRWFCTVCISFLNGANYNLFADKNYLCDRRTRRFPHVTHQEIHCLSLSSRVKGQEVKAGGQKGRGGVM